VDGDSHDWIANGLRLAGEDVRYSGRSPLLPLAIALLHRASALSWLPVLVQGLFAATVLVFYRRAALLVPRQAALVAALALLANHSLADLSLLVMADVPASCLLFLAAAAFLRAGEAESGRSWRWDLASGLLAGLAALTQSVGVLWTPAAGATALVHRRRDLRSPVLWAGLLAPVVLPALWAMFQPPALGDAASFARAQWRLVAFHTGSVPFYLYALASLLGIPGAVLLAAGAVPAAHGARREPAFFLSLALGSVVALFFVFLYDFDAKRFLVYGVWFGGLLVAAALARLRRTAFAVAAGLLLIGSVLPLPTAGNDPSAVGLWPAPPVYAAAPFGGTAATGSAVIDLRAVRVLRQPLASWLRFSVPYRAWQARARDRAFVRRDPAAFAADRSALFLYGQTTDGGGRYRTITRLSSALYKRVKFVSAATFEPYWRWIGVSPLGTLADYALYRARLPGSPGTWLLAVTADSPLRRRLDALAPAPSPTAAESPQLTAGRETAEAVRRFVAGGDGFVALVPPRQPEPLQLYLPFLLDSTELWVAEPGHESEMLALLAPALVLAQQSFGPATVKKTEYLERKTSLISYRP
jgi:hypothetical protein